MVPEIIIWAAKHPAMIIKVTHGSRRTVLLSCPMGIIILFSYIKSENLIDEEVPKLILTTEIL